MAILSRPSFGPRAALLYVTVGALLDVWTGVWYFAFKDANAPLSNSTIFWVLGLFLTGITLIVIGLLLGPLGQQARKAELPPADAVNAEASIQQTAAAHPPALQIAQPEAIVPPPVHSNFQRPASPTASPRAVSPA